MTHSTTIALGLVLGTALAGCHSGGASTDNTNEAGAASPSGVAHGADGGAPETSGAATDSPGANPAPGSATAANGPSASGTSGAAPSNGVPSNGAPGKPAGTTTPGASASPNGAGGKAPTTPTGGGAASDAGMDAEGAAGSAGTPESAADDAPSGESSMDGGAGSGVTPGSETVCATAPEDGAAKLTCPEGQVIDQVVFSSYGTPTGQCGGFAAGDCAAVDSDGEIESRCVGRHSCSVPATNGVFGDPCRGKTKKLALEVSCVAGEPVAGEPVAGASGPYKGVANSPASQLSELGATWCYNWGTRPESTDCDDPYFVPMIWGSGDVASAVQAIGKAGYTTVLGFNEPNKSDQANLSVAEAIAQWPDLTSDPNLRVSSPAVSDDGRAWLEDFMEQAKSQDLRVDFIAMHWYGWNEGSCTASQLEGAVKWASQWGLPVWITEFGCMGSSNTDEQTLLKFYGDAITMLDAHPLVERYAWYPWNTYNHLYDDGGAITALGQAFAAAPQSR